MKGWTRREWAALALLVLGAGAVLLSLPFAFMGSGPDSFYLVGLDGPRFLGYGLFLDAIAVIGEGATHYMDVDSWGGFLLGPALLAGFTMSCLSPVPSVALFLLARRSRLFLWAGRTVWVLMIVPGPLLFIGSVLSEGLVLRGGFWCWIVGILLLAISFWGLPVPERAGLERELLEQEGH